MRGDDDERGQRQTGKFGRCAPGEPVGDYLGQSRHVQGRSYGEGLLQDVILVRNNHRAVRAHYDQTIQLWWRL